MQAKACIPFLSKLSISHLYHTYLLMNICFSNDMFHSNRTPA
nr:MAG TPA: hypothetical protein [Crassvirales sp.]